MTLMKLSDRSDLVKSKQEYSNLLTGLLAELDNTGVNQEEEVTMYHLAMRTICIANACLLAYIAKDDARCIDLDRRNGDFLTLYAYLQPGRYRPSLTLISGLQVILEDAMKRIYNGRNMNAEGLDDPRYRHYPIIHLLSKLNPNHATAIVPFHGLVLPEDMHYTMHTMLRAAQADQVPNTRTPDEIWYLYNSFDRSSYLEFIKLYVTKIVRLIDQL